MRRRSIQLKIESGFQSIRLARVCGFDSQHASDLCCKRLTPGEGKTVEREGGGKRVVAWQRNGTTYMVVCMCEMYPSCWPHTGYVGCLYTWELIWG